ncbi:MAG TPA: hypothetical protein VM431_11180, partial [Phycisphaerae bacterium]|nr:hypothetical protein [Phycisphaerae bacterium]
LWPGWGHSGGGGIALSASGPIRHRSPASLRRRERQLQNNDFFNGLLVLDCAVEGAFANAEDFAGGMCGGSNTLLAAQHHIFPAAPIAGVCRAEAEETWAPF